MGAATRCGVHVIHIVGRNANTVAEFTVGMMVSEMRNIARSDCAMRGGVWYKGEMIMSELEHLLPMQHQLGESPMWVPEEKALYWIDWGACVCRFYPDSGVQERFEVDVPITALARRASGGWIIVAQTGLYFWDPQTNLPTLITEPEPENPHIRFNDSAVDRQGRLLVGTFNSEDLEAPDGSLYRLDPDGSKYKLDTGFATSNGLAVSPDGKTFYLTDMRHSLIYAYDYDPATGAVSNRCPFVQVPKEDGLPDGLITDSEGFVWSAHWGGWRVTRYDPTGKIEREIRLPVENVTCFAFGGEALDELYITTAWYGFTEEQRGEQPLSGDLFRIKTDVKGLVEPGFAG